MSDIVSESPAAAGGSGLSEVERAELLRLRVEVAKKRRRRVGWRAPVATVLVLLGCLLVVGLVVAVAAFFAGPSTTAVKTRRAIVRVSAVALVAIIFVFWGQPTPALGITLAAILLALLGLVELIGRPPPAPATEQPGYG